MKLFMCNGNRGACPGCGRRRTARRSVPRSRQAAAVSGDAATASVCGNGSACATPTPSQELYGVQQTNELVRTCCDVYCGCREFPAAARDSFWPGFAHPRWLPCNQLYNGCDD